MIFLRTYERKLDGNRITMPAEWAKELNGAYFIPGETKSVYIVGANVAESLIEAANNEEFGKFC